MLKPVDQPWCSTLCPIQPHELPKPLRRGLESMVERVTAEAAREGAGQDLLLRVYLAGMHHAREAITG